MLARQGAFESLIVVSLGGALGLLLAVQLTAPWAYEYRDLVGNMPPRPVGLAIGDTTGLFRIDPATHEATRPSVHTGRVSVDRVEVLSGLGEGDEVILSDMSRFAADTAVLLE